MSLLPPPRRTLFPREVRAAQKRIHELQDRPIRRAVRVDHGYDVTGRSSNPGKGVPSASLLHYPDVRP
jgi:hypothetical protein